MPTYFFKDGNLWRDRDNGPIWTDPEVMRNLLAVYSADTQEAWFLARAAVLCDEIKTALEQYEQHQLQQA